VLDKWKKVTTLCGVSAFHAATPAAGAKPKPARRQWALTTNKGYKMKKDEFVPNGINITNQCYNCLLIDDVCFDCQESRDARDTNNAWQIVDEGNLQYPHPISIQSVEPSAHDWIGAYTIQDDGTIREEFLEQTTLLSDRIFELDVEIPPQYTICVQCHYQVHVQVACPNCETVSN